MAKATKQIERKGNRLEEERNDDLSAILNQIADNRESIQIWLDIIHELHQIGILDMIKGLLRTREKVGAIAMEQINQPGMHNIIKNGMSGFQLLAAMDADQLKQIMDGFSRGMQKASENTQHQEQIGMWGLLRSMQDPNVKKTLNILVHFLNGMGEGLQTHRKNE